MEPCCSIPITRRSVRRAQTDCPASKADEPTRRCQPCTMNTSCNDVASFDLSMYASHSKSKIPQDLIDCSACCSEDTPEVTEQCTDQCVVIACDDHTHNAAHDSDPCELNCDYDRVCEGCHPLDDFFEKCCEPGFHHHSPETHHDLHASFDWNACFSPSVCRGCDEPATLSPSASSDPSTSTIPDYSPPFHVHECHGLHPSHQALTQVLDESTACLWANCNVPFDDFDQLLQHVNTDHLLLPSSLITSSQSDSLSCLWGDCHQSLPVAPQNDALLQLMATHIRNEHLNVQWRSSSAASDPPLDFAMASPSETDSRKTPSADTDASSCPDTHSCHWSNCSRSFSTCDELTNHLTVAHVGSGRAHYDCHWKDCTRHGDHGFASKQKICRHIQSHTGHRPFQCTVCKQYFSEQATLQQHMRRHTHEKPYACDHPGCEKRFAIAGALTIHKRIHNGDKPFKCSFCERAFTESSNLSKHLRTHTGARPYRCAEAGCTKSFARPDQLTRHKGTHAKSRLSPVTSLVPQAKAVIVE